MNINAMKNGEWIMSNKDMSDLISGTPKLVNTDENGEKLAWYEKDLTSAENALVDDILTTQQGINELAAPFEQAKIIVNAMMDKQQLQGLLLDKLRVTAPGTPIREASAKAKLVKTEK